MRGERVARAAAAKARDGFAEHVGASPGDRAKNLRHRAAHAYQVVTAVEGRERSQQGHAATARRWRDQVRRERWRIGAITIRRGASARHLASASRMKALASSAH